MIISDADISKTLKAIKYAADKHRDQRRKNKEASPYINHPIDVAELLWTVGKVRDMKVIVAALLHDTLEDTNATRKEIETLFGKKVFSLVKEVTDDKSLPKPERKRLQIEHAPHLSRGAKQIKLADKISNIREMITSPPMNWSCEEQEQYVKWGQNVVHGLKGCNEILEQCFDKIIKQFQKSR